MFGLYLILAAGSLSTLISGAPVPSFLSGSVTEVTTTHLSEERRSAGTYITTFGGDGSVADGWPSLDQWVSDLDTMFTDNNDILTSSCTQFNVPNNSPQEISDLQSAIVSVAASTGVDARFIFAITMQESNGCVRAPTTNYGVRNPGLMQDHDGTGTCNDATVSNPCPSSEITQMITDGTAGTAAGDGLKQCIAESGATDVSQYYKAARIYNSGSIDPSGNLGKGIATACYASDVANRLLGWSSGPSGCSPATVGSLTTTSGSIPAAVSSSDPVAVTTTPAPTSTAGVPTSSSVPTSSAPSSVAAPSTPAAVTPPSVSATSVLVSPTPAPSSGSPPDRDSNPGGSTPPATSSGAETVGSPCPKEGTWNCINGTSFQQCASGTWSAVQTLAAGMKCTEGQSMVFGVSAVASMAKRGSLTIEK